MVARTARRADTSEWKVCIIASGLGLKSPKNHRPAGEPLASVSALEKNP